MTKVEKVVVGLILSLICIEFWGRYYGLHHYPLFENNARYEYIHKANQDVMIYRNHFITNEYAMRSDKISKKDTLVVLLIGDSILNGGNQVDHDSLASTRIQKRLVKETGKNIKVLNVSSYSWGPENIYQYLKSHGAFNADIAIIINNSGDAYDRMTFKGTVGSDNGRPDFNYQFATFKLIEKGIYALKPIFYSKAPTRSLTTVKEPLDVGFGHLVNYFKMHNIPYYAYLHADKSEIASHKYNDEGVAVINFYRYNKIPLIEELKYNVSAECYLDDIHFNFKGQRIMADILYPYIRKNF